MYQSLTEIAEESEKKNIPFWKTVQLDDCSEEALSENESFIKMGKILSAMKDADKNYDVNLKSASGLVGTSGEKIHIRRINGMLICGDVIGNIMERALKTAESNACMKRIVAAPTAGSCGVMPAVFLSIQEKYDLPDERLIEALYVAGGIGGVIAHKASLSGAEGGCQAEIGSASAMTAGGLVHLWGGTNEQILHASAIALKSLLGLACDPVAGLVEVPCVKRNVTGAINAVTAADMALAGIKSVIPPDEVIDAMGTIGKEMNSDIRETGLGGLAATPTGRQIRKNMSIDLR